MKFIRFLAINVLGLLMFFEYEKKRSVYTLPRQEYYNSFNMKIQDE